MRAPSGKSGWWREKGGFLPFYFRVRAFSIPRTQLSQSLEQAMAKRIATPSIKRSYYTRCSFILNRTHFCGAGLSSVFVVVVVVVVLVLFLFLFFFICHYFAGYILTLISY